MAQRKRGVTPARIALIVGSAAGIAGMIIAGMWAAGVIVAIGAWLKGLLVVAFGVEVTIPIVVIIRDSGDVTPMVTLRRRLDARTARRAAIESARRPIAMPGGHVEYEQKEVGR